MKKEIYDTAIKDVRNFLRLKKENKAVKDTRNIRNLFEYEEKEESYHKPVRTSIFSSNNYIEYESKGDRNKALSVEKNVNKVRPYLKDIINNLKKSDTWKIQSTIAINFISSVDNDEEHVMHSKSGNKEILINGEADEVIKELLKSHKNRRQNNLESMKGIEFVF